MEFHEIKPNNRLQIECENDEAVYRNVRGIVIDATEKSVVMVTDFGELMEILQEKVLSITQITFPKTVSEALINIKNYYTEVYELEHKLKLLREKESGLRQNLFDASFLAKFNIQGAKNRLDKSVNPSYLFFEKDVQSYQIYFKSNPNNQIEIWFYVSNQFEHYNVDEIGDVDKIIRNYAPKVKDVISKSFPFAVKTEELETKVIHEKDTFYSVQTCYKTTIDIDENNFLTIRADIIKGLERLRK